MKKKPDPSGYSDEDPIPPEITAQYRWGVFKEGKTTYVARYHPSVTYPWMIKGLFSTKEEAERARNE
jgi:hypothetical protein